MVVSVLLGAAVTTAVLVVVASRRPPTVLALAVCRTVVAVACAGWTALLLGEVPVRRAWSRAGLCLGGALIVGALIYLGDPARLAASARAVR